MKFDNQTTRSVADAVTRILSGQPVSEELKGDQHKIDANKNNKIDAEDFKILRGEKKTVKEESCEDEAKEEVKKHEKKHHGKDGDVSKHEKEMHKEESELEEASALSSGIRNSMSKAFKDGVKHGKAGAEKDKSYLSSYANKTTYLNGYKQGKQSSMKEETEQLDEYDSKEGRYVHKGTYGYAGKGAEHGDTDYDKENKMEKELNKKKPARKGYGARQNFVRSYAKESFSGLLDVYREGGLKSLHEALIVEEPTNDEFQAELADHKAKAELKKKQPDIAKPSVQAVKVEEEVELSVDDINGVKVSTIEERSLTEPEMNKKEEIVKGMKKNLAGFKARYGDDAKSVMYATATKAAKKD